MPSGISHMLLSRNLELGADCPYRYKMRQNTRYLQIGSVAPDLPYASVLDNDLFESESELANLFHFTAPGQNIAQAPNQLPLLGLEHVRHLVQKGENKRECDALFWFIAGYASHVIADGICHPYVMDKVGRYEGSNKAEHRALEMGIDVLLFKHFTADSGYAIETNYAGMDTFIAGFNELKYATLIYRHFATLIRETFGVVVEPNEIQGWVVGMSRLFGLAAGNWLDILRQLDATRPYVFRNIQDLEGREDEYLLLGRPRFWDQNFHNMATVHFLNDCVPRFNTLMKNFLDQAYAYVYDSGPQIGADDLPSFSLDTGRTVCDFDNIALKPLLWQFA